MYSTVPQKEYALPASVSTYLSIATGERRRRRRRGRRRRRRRGSRRRTREGGGREGERERAWG